MEILIPKSVQKIITRFEQNGFEAYAVGGCIRDSLLGIAPADWDITTNACVDEIKRCFSDFHIIETGIQHGTVTVVIDSENYEITTYRVDGEYTDCRRPNSVIFTSSLEEDLKRRDFTINALACNGKRLIDCFNGIEDLNNGIIRCVGNADKRFSEDALRILRALRFSSVYGFAVEEKTAAAIHSNYKLLKKISAERIFAELKKLLCGKDVYRILTDFSELFAFIIPELEQCIDYEQNNPHHNRSLYEHTAAAVSNAPANEVLRFALLLHDLGKPYVKTTDARGISHYYGHNEKSAQIARNIFKNLKCSNEFSTAVTELVYLHDLPVDSEKRLKHLIAEYSQERISQLFAVKKADISAQSNFMREQKLQALEVAEEKFKEILSSNTCLTLKQLDINGTDLMQIGVPQGKQIGKILNLLFESVINGEIENKKDVLLTEAKKILNL